MEKSPKLRDCIGEDGYPDLESYVIFKKRRDELLEENEAAEPVPPKKMPFRNRNNEGYNPNDCFESDWYRRYVRFPDQPLNKKHMNLFRRRFRMPHTAFLDLVREAREDKWFPDYERRNALGEMGILLEILILGALRYLGRGWTFDDLYEATSVSEEVHRRFFKVFVVACRKHLYPKWVKRPETPEEIEDCMSEYAEAGFDGCIGSADVTHIILERCHYKLKNQNLGGKSSHTTRAFQIVANHRRQIIASTVGYPGRWNDMTIVRFDGFVTDMQNGNYLNDHKFTLKDSEGKDENYTGAWILVDGGYLNWPTLICPFKHSQSKKEQRWSKWAESMRKDVECTFGILKGN